MNTLQQKVNELIEQSKQRLEAKGEFFKATGHYGEGIKHSAMCEVAKAYRKKGYIVKSSVNHGVTDWEIYKPVNVEI